jgi:hypothetical protein
MWQHSISFNEVTNKIIKITIIITVKNIRIKRSDLEFDHVTTKQDQFSAHLSDCS